MNKYIFTEAEFFLSSFLLGFVLMCIYDAIRVIRKLIIHGKLLVILEDLIYWIAAGIVVFMLIFDRNSGVLRFYEGISLSLGMFLYINFIGDRIVDFTENVAEGVRRKLRGILQKFMKKCKIGKKSKNRAETNKS